MSREEAILVTGGLGLVGAALTAHLAGEGRRVVVLDDASTGSPEAVEKLAGVDWVKADVTSAEALEKLPELSWSGVFHLAAQTDVRASVQDPSGDFRANGLGTLRLLEWCRRRGVDRFVYTSSVAVYDPSAAKPIREDAPLGPTSPYGASKLAGEMLALAWHRTYGMSTAILRLFNVYGPGMTKYVIHDLVRKLQRDPGRLEILGSGEQVRDYVYVADAAAALAVAFERAPAGAVLNMGSGRPVRILDLAAMIVSAMGLDRVDMRVTGRSWAGDVDAWYADASLLRDLGWQPRVGLEEGLQRTVAALTGSGTGK